MMLMAATRETSTKRAYRARDGGGRREPRTKPRSQSDPPPATPAPPPVTPAPPPVTPAPFRHSCPLLPFLFPSVIPAPFRHSCVGRNQAISRALGRVLSRHPTWPPAQSAGRRPNSSLPPARGETPHLTSPLEGGRLGGGWESRAAATAHARPDRLPAPPLRLPAPPLRHTRALFRHSCAGRNPGGCQCLVCAANIPTGCRSDV